MTASVGTDPLFEKHDPGPGHPERTARWRAALAAVETRVVHRVDARPADPEELVRVHGEPYVARIASLRGRWTALDPDTHLSEASVDAALKAAGLTIDQCCAVADGSAPPGLAIVRPPGHHATADQAMGFCVFNNAAAAARALQDRGLAERVAIYDWDVHHGNGTEAIFWNDPTVLYASTHQFPFYPGTGRRSDTGAGKGEGATVNVPLAAGDGDDEILAASKDVLEPAVRAFRPDFILISAGYDAHARDPLGQLEVTTEGFRTLATRWRALADELCHGRIAGVLEGGYDLTALTEAVGATLDAWA